MNIYRNLNELINYIDDNLDNPLSSDDIARFLRTNSYTASRLFAMLSGVTLTEYIRNRRLSQAGYDLYANNMKVVDVAVRYQYDNATSFSRAFEKFHGVKPSLVKSDTKLKNFPKLHFDETINLKPFALNYEIVELGEQKLSGVSITTNNNKIGADAPRFFIETTEKYHEYGPIDYGMITYDPAHEESQEYYCLWVKDIPELKQITLPPAKWLKFRVENQTAKDIQKLSHDFYYNFLPSVDYKLRELPELEHYHDGVTDFYVAIE